MADQAEHYDPSRYDRPSVTVDVVIFTLHSRELHVLLVQRKRWPHEGRWAIPGGFINIDESLEQAARRELEEETGVRDIYLEQLYTFGEPKRDPRTRVISVAYIALVSADKQTLRVSDENTDVRWFQLLPEVFSILELKHIYEQIWGEGPIDKGNFYRKIKDANVLEDTGIRREGRGRPTTLYRFRRDRGDKQFVFRWREDRIDKEDSTDE